MGSAPGSSFRPRWRAGSGARPRASRRRRGVLLAYSGQPPGPGAPRSAGHAEHEHASTGRIAMTFAQRMSRLGTETAFEVLARARALEAKGRSVVHLEIGEPDFDTPRFIRQAAVAALEEGFTHYGPSAGLPEFRQVIAEIWHRERGIPCSAENVVVTPGAKPIMFFVMLALLEEGDEVLYPNPGFPIYQS